MPSSRTKLSGQYDKAMEVLWSQVPLQSVTPFQAASSSVYTQGNFSLFPGVIPPRVIPREGSWRWTPVKSKKVVPFDHASVTICPLSPKVLHSQSTQDTVAPDFLLWMFHLFLPNQEPMTAIWCERGTASDLNVDDYKFLAQFMCPEVAAEIWNR